MASNQKSDAELTKEEREARVKANRQELERLLAEKAKKTGGPTPEEQRNRGLNLAAATYAPGQATAKQPLHPNLANTVFNDGYDDDEDEYDDYYDEDDDEFDHELDEFERELEAGDMLAPGASAAVDTTTRAQKPTTTIVGAEVPRAPRQFGEFEALRLCKLGDLEELRNFEAEEGVNFMMLTDNNKRNVLHYAADGGNTELCKYLMVERKVPVVGDENGMTAYDIAVLTRNDDCAKFILATAPAGILKETTAGEVRTKFQPKPPGMSLSKAPTAAPMTGKRSFWGSTSPGSTASPTSEVSVCPPTEDFPVNDAVELIEKAVCATAAEDGNQQDRWLHPFTKRQFKAMCAVTPHIVSVDRSTGKIDGLMTLFLLGTSIHKGTPIAPCSLTGNWCVTPEKAKQGSMMNQAFALLQGEKHQASFFHSKKRLPFPSIGTLKYFRRCVNPKQVFDSPVRDEVYPDFMKYDTVLRCDAILKGQIPLSPVSGLWKQLDYDEDGEAVSDELCQFFNTHSPKQFELWVDWDKRLFLWTFLRPGMTVHIKRSAQGKISDVIIFRSRFARADGDINASTLVGCLFTSVSGEERLVQAGQVASEHLGASVVYATNTFGITEKDLRLAFFEEVIGSAEFIYAAKSPALAACPAVPPAKIALPLAVI